MSVKLESIFYLFLLFGILLTFLSMFSFHFKLIKLFVSTGRDAYTYIGVFKLLGFIIYYYLVVLLLLLSLFLLLL